MMRHRQFLLALLFFGSLAGAQVHADQKGKQTNAQKRDEKRENEAVRQAQQDVKAAQSAEEAAEKGARQAREELVSAERSVIRAVSRLQSLRDEMEATHAEAAGLRDARREAEAARRAYETAGRPVLQRLAETEPYRSAVAAAKSADNLLTRRAKVSEDDSEAHLKEMAEAVRLKQIPGRLEREALDASPELQRERMRLVDAEAAVAAARLKADRAFEKDPVLRAANHDVSQAKKEASTASEAAAQADRRLTQSRQKLTREKQNLQQKIAADRRDDNQPNSKK